MRFLLVFLLAVLGLVGAWLLPGILAGTCLTRAGYWLLLAAFVIWGWALARVLPRAWRAIDWQPADLWCGGAVIAAGFVLILQEPAGFKVPANEIPLLGTSMAMHWERSVFMPQRAIELHGFFELLFGPVDSQPVFFPFLLSVVHDLTGYRPENAFLLNGLLTFVLLGLSYGAGRALAGWRGGLLAVLVWTALPLLSQQASGGDSAILQAVMILSTALLAGWHWRQRDGWSLTALVFSGVLLAQTRPESPLFLLPVIGVALAARTEGPASSLRWLVAASPLFLLSWPWIWRASGAFGRAGFSPGGWPENFGHALVFWFGGDGTQPSAPLVNALGFLAVAGAAVALPRIGRAWPGQPTAVKVAYLFAATLLLQLGLLLGHPAGRFDEPLARSAALSSHLLFALVPALVLGFLPRPRLAWSAAVGLVAAGFILSGPPTLARRGATSLHAPALDTAWRREFIGVHPDRDFLFIDQDTPLWVTHRISATAPAQARARPADFAFNLHHRMYSGIYVFQHFTIEPGTGALAVWPDDDLGPAYELEPVAEHTFQLNVLSRISRVKAVHPADMARVTPAAIQSEPPAPTPDQRARDYALLEEWLKRLP